jgi:hypothetical protein
MAEIAEVVIAYLKCPEYKMRRTPGLDTAPMDG